MKRNQPRNVTPQDILDAMRIEADTVQSLQRVIDLQQELIEMQRDTITLQKQSISYLKEICDLKDMAFAEFSRRLKES